MVRQSVRGARNPGPLAGAYISWMLSYSRIDRIVGERMRNHLWQAARWVVHEAGAIGQSVRGTWNPGPLAGAYLSWMLSYSRIDRIVGERMRNHLWQAARWVVHEAGAIGQSVMGGATHGIQQHTPELSQLRVQATHLHPFLRIE